MKEGKKEGRDGKKKNGKKAPKPEVPPALELLAQQALCDGDDSLHHG